MGKSPKAFSLLLVLILSVSSLIMVESASTQQISKPSVPKFSLSLEDKGIKVSIVNQPFTPYSKDDNLIKLYYGIRLKEHSANDWTYYYPHSALFEASSTQLTIISYSLDRNSGADAKLSRSNAGSQMDFEVEALIGYYFTQFNPSNPMPSPDEKFHYFFDGESSGYSNSQTITIPEISPTTSPTPNPTPTPAVPEFPLLAILLLVSAITLTSILILRKRSKLYSFSLS
jgi:hypothetical protein